MITLLLLILCKNKTETMKRLQGFLLPLAIPSPWAVLYPQYSLKLIFINLIIKKKVIWFEMTTASDLSPRTGATSAY